MKELVVTLAYVSVRAYIWGGTGRETSDDV